MTPLEHYRAALGALRGVESSTSNVGPLIQSAIDGKTNFAVAVASSELCLSLARTHIQLGLLALAITDHAPDVDPLGPRPDEEAVP